MATNMVDFSVIIPQKGSVSSLVKLFDTIPDDPRIEIILVENNERPLTKEEIGIKRDYILLRAEPSRFAGGARNEGMKNAHGKWLVFSDADDYFTQDAFTIFYSQINSDADIVYFTAEGIYPDTGEKSPQADLYKRLVKEYLNDQKKELDLRLSFHVPWAKMVRRSFVEKNELKYDEVVANNDDFFALTAGYYANRIEAIDKPVYYYTVNRGSIMRRRSKFVMRTRLEVILRCNRFKKQHGLSKYQSSLGYFLSEAAKYGPLTVFEFIALIIKYGQNPFIGCKNWFRTFRKIRQQGKIDNKYIIRD